MRGWVVGLLVAVLVVVGAVGVIVLVVVRDGEDQQPSAATTVAISTTAATSIAPVSTTTTAVTAPSAAPPSSAPVDTTMAVYPGPTACPDYSMARPEPGAGEMVVTVFYSCDVDAEPVPTYRLHAATLGVLRAALEQLLAGPTPAETDAGLQSWFSTDTAAMLAGVDLQSGRATVDFHDPRRVIPNASTSAGSRLLLSQLDATVFQFPSVDSVVYRIEGDCEAFNEWLQFGGCEPRRRAP